MGVLGARLGKGCEWLEEAPAAGAATGSGCRSAAGSGEGALAAGAGSAAGALLLIIYFRKIEKNYLREGITVGLAWLAINIILDLIILVPMSQMNTGAYFAEIGLRYLTIPITSTAIGYVAENKSK